MNRNSRGKGRPPLRSPAVLIPSRKSGRILVQRRSWSHQTPILQKPTGTGKNWLPLNERIKKEILRFQFQWNSETLQEGSGYTGRLAQHLIAKLPEYPIRPVTVLRWTQRHPWIMAKGIPQFPRGKELYNKVRMEFASGRGEDAGNDGNEASGSNEESSINAGVANEYENVRDLMSTIVQFQSTMDTLASSLRGLAGLPDSTSRAVDEDKSIYAERGEVFGVDEESPVSTPRPIPREIQKQLDRVNWKASELAQMHLANGVDMRRKMEESSRSRRKWGKPVPTVSCASLISVESEDEDIRVVFDSHLKEQSGGTSIEEVHLGTGKKNPCQSELGEESGEIVNELIIGEMTKRVEDEAEGYDGDDGGAASEAETDGAG